MQAIALLNEDPLGSALRERGIRAICLNMAKGRIDPLALSRLVRILRKEKPDVVQTWLQQSDLLGGIAAKLAGVGPVLWNIRHSTLHPKLTSPQTYRVSKVCARVSAYIPTRIVCGSEAAREEQIKFGYSPDKLTVISNGVDTSLFKPDSVSYHNVRKELGIPATALLFGAIGRRHPAKDHPAFILAAGEIAAKLPRSHFLLCGEEVDPDQPDLTKLIRETGCPERFHLLGQRNDVPRLMAALDMLISSSCFSEGFPNVVAEAMACGVPCIVTDVGDSARIVGPTGYVVEPGQPSATARIALDCVRAGKDVLRALGNEARRRIIERFSMPIMVSRYQDLYLETAAAHCR